MHRRSLPALNEKQHVHECSNRLKPREKQREDSGRACTRHGVDSVRSFQIVTSRYRSPSRTKVSSANVNTRDRIPRVLFHFRIKLLRRFLLILFWLFLRTLSYVRPTCCTSCHLSIRVSLSENKLRFAIEYFSTRIVPRDSLSRVGFHVRKKKHAHTRTRRKERQRENGEGA